MEPARGLNTQSAYEKRRFEINRVLMLKGIEIRDDGNFYKITKAESLSEVERRTRELKNKLSCYGAHQRVLICCREELLVDDYFHAVQEAVKGICDRVREMSGLLTDGNELIQTAFSVKNPYIVLNSLRTTSEQNQQNGLKEIILGLIHMVRNVTAHELRIRWDINENDWYIAVVLFVKAILFGGIEEIGWRYTFQPIIEQQHNYVFSTCVTFVFWGIWHFLYFYIEGSIQFVQVGSFLLGLLINCFILSALYYKTKSLWICVMTHALINTLSQISVGGNLMVSMICKVIIICIAIFISRGVCINNEKRN